MFETCNFLLKVEGAVLEDKEKQVDKLKLGHWEDFHTSMIEVQHEPSVGMSLSGVDEIRKK